MVRRKPIIAGNWKMYKKASEARELVRTLVSGLSKKLPSCEVVVAPPFTSITAAVSEVSGTGIAVAAQNIHWEDYGAFTGEVSGPMLKELGCTYVIVGHSERRQFFGESDGSVNLRMSAALRNGLVPIFCLGEMLDEREAGITFEVVKRQLSIGLGEIQVPDPALFVIAYEPVWAIGTGKTATPEQAQEVHCFLRHELGVLRGKDFAESVRILYGGSVKPDNAASLMKCADIDGGLVGGASLKAPDFLGIIEQGC